MGVVLTDNVTDHTGGLLIGLVPVVVQLVHGEQYAAMHRLEAVAHIRQRPPNDHAHGVIQVRLFEFVFDVDRGNFSGEIRHSDPYFPQVSGKPLRLSQAGP